MQIETHIQGIPCIVELLYYLKADPGRVSGPPEDCWPAEPMELDFAVLDRRGRHAPWLQKKLTETDVERIEKLFLKEIERETDPY